MAKKYSEIELIGALGGFQMLLIGGLIEQGAVDRDKLRAFLQDRLDERLQKDEENASVLMLQQALRFLTRTGGEQWTLQ